MYIIYINTTPMNNTRDNRCPNACDITSTYTSLYKCVRPVHIHLSSLSTLSTNKLGEITYIVLQI